MKSQTKEELNFFIITLTCVEYYEYNEQINGFFLYSIDCILEAYVNDSCGCIH